MKERESVSERAEMYGTFCASCVVRLSGVASDDASHETTIMDSQNPGSLDGVSYIL